jgi:hypothetical protein
MIAPLLALGLSLSKPAAPRQEAAQPLSAAPNKYREAIIFPERNRPAKSQTEELYSCQAGLEAVHRIGDTHWS